MPDFSRSRGVRVARPAGGPVAAILALSLLLALGGPVLGAAANKLTDPSVSPRTATTATTVVFEVTYTRPMEPETVWVVVAGANRTMARAGGEWSGQARYRWAGTLPAGQHAVTFKGTGVKDLAGGSVTITVPPTPKPTPTPTPRPTPKPTPKPTPTLKPTPTPTPKPTATATARPTATPAATTPPTTPSPAPSGTAGLPTAPSPAPSGTAGPAGTDEPSTAPSLEPSPSATPASGPPTPAPSGEPVVTGALPGGSTGTPPFPGNPSSGATPPGPGGPFGRPWSPEADLISRLGLDGFRLPPMTLAQTMVTTTGVATMAMAFSIFGKRRRDDDEDESIADRAAQGVSVLDAPFEEAVAAALAAAPEIPDAEAGMPRWRRPSLLLARKADPIRDGVDMPRLTFDNGLIGPIDGRERRVIKYNVVTLLDGPDEIRANGIGVLTKGDEIQLLEKNGVYWHVLCPDGSQGWVHKMTVGELVGSERPVEGPRATMPTVAESWTLAEDDVDDDVLSAYLAARRLE